MTFIGFYNQKSSNHRFSVTKNIAECKGLNNEIFTLFIRKNIEFSRFALGSKSKSSLKGLRYNSGPCSQGDLDNSRRRMRSSLSSDAKLIPSAQSPSEKRKKDTGSAKFRTSPAAVKSFCAYRRSFREQEREERERRQL